MQKVIFDIEDRPPPAYFKEMAKLKLESGGKDLSAKTIDASEWCKAPEFVPKGLNQRTASKPNEWMNHEKIINNNHIIKNFDKNINTVPMVNAAQGSQGPELVPRTLPVLPNVTLPSIINNIPPGRPLIPNGFQCQSFMQATVTQRPPRLLVNTPVQLISYRPQFSRPLMQLPTTAPLVMPTKLPCGFTSVNTTSLGAQMQAILLKKKRRKKPKHCDENTANYPLMNNEQDTAVENGKKPISHEDLSVITAELRSVVKNTSRRSGSEEKDGIQQRSSNQNSYFPADLDLIQSTANCPAFTGSWPDLSAPQRKIIDDFQEQITHDNFGVKHSSSDLSNYSSEDISHKKSDDEETELLSQSMVHHTEGSQFYPTIDASLKQKSKQMLVCSTSDNKTWSEVIDSSEDATNIGFLPYSLKTFSLPDVHLIATKAQRTCCSIM